MLKPGDIILLHGTSFLSRVIQFAANSHWNHGALYAGEAWGQPFVFEAALQGVRAYPLEMYRSDERLVLRPAEDVGASVVSECLKYLGRWYDFASYPALLLRGLRLRFPWLPYRVEGNTNPFLYCFELVATAYRDAGYPLVASELVLPRYFLETVEEGRLRVVRGELRR